MKRISFDLLQLQAFIAVAERGSFRAAADEIHLSPPALSRRIERLETSLGVRLFERTTRKVELTSLGRVFLERARAALDDLEGAMLGISDIAATRSGRVTVACVPSAASYFLPAVVRAFSEQYPGVRLRIVDEAVNLVMSSVISGEADFGISFMSTQVPEIDFDPIHTDPFVLAVRREHRFAKRKSVAWAELEGERVIAAARSSGNRQLIDDALAKAGMHPVVALEVGHIATLLGMVDAGLGVAAVPRMSLPATHPTLMGIPLRDPVSSRTLGLVTRHGATLKPAAEIFHRHLREALGARKRPRAGK
jgi:DNA-binding transcriptional LysR family regulator